MDWLLDQIPSRVRLVTCAAAALGAARLIHWYLVSRRRVRNTVQGKVVLITGASSGLGKALAETLHAQGARLILAARSLEKLKDLADSLNALNIPGTYEPIYRYLDLADSTAGSFEEFIKDALEGTGGQLDILINNGGMSMRGNCKETEMAVHRRVMEVNYFGQIALTQVALPSLVTSRGLVVLISSVQGKIALPNRSSYSASKHAAQAYFDSLRAEVAKDGVRVLNVSPGYIQTELSLNALTGSGTTYGKMDETSAKGMTAQDAAAAVLASMASGDQEIVLSGLTPKLAILLRYICPALYFFVMEKRAAKELRND